MEAAYRKLEEHQKQFVEVLAQDNARAQKLQDEFRAAEWMRRRQAEAMWRPHGSAPPSIPEVTGNAGRGPSDTGTPRDKGSAVALEPVNK